MTQLNDTPAALEDLTILDLCDEKGHLMGKLLGEMGARVIKIEPPGGEMARQVGPFRNDEPDPNQSLFFWTNNSSKESATLNLESEVGQGIFKNMAQAADIVLESFDPGYLESLGLGYPQLADLNPTLIMTSLTGFGQDGPYRDYMTSDLVAMAMGGIMHSCGYDDVPGSPPIRPTERQGYNTGSHFGVIATLMAVVYRDMTGEGQYVDASIHEACSCTTEAAMPQYMYMKQLVHRQTARHHSANSTPKSLCPTSDGKFINVFALFTNLHSWRTLITWMDEAGMVEDLLDEKYRDMAMHRIRTGDEVEHAFNVLRRFIKAHTADEIYHGAQQRRFPWGVIRSPDETLDDPHLWERGFFERVEHPELGESYIYPGRPYILNKTPWRTRRAPLVGEHNHKVYVDDLGLTEDEVERLQQDGVI